MLTIETESSTAPLRPEVQNVETFPCPIHICDDVAVPYLQSHTKNKLLNESHFTPFRRRLNRISHCSIENCHSLLRENSIFEDVTLFLHRPLDSDTPDSYVTRKMMDYSSVECNNFSEDVDRLQNSGILHANSTFINALSQLILRSKNCQYQLMNGVTDIGYPRLDHLLQIISDSKKSMSVK